MRVLLLALCGCSSVFGLHEPARTDDAAVDVTDGPSTDGSLCFGHGAFVACLSQMPDTPVALPATIDTAASTLCTDTASWQTASQPATCFVVATDITQSGTTRVTGSRPLAIIATGSVTLQGIIDASSHLGVDTAGAGALSTCGAFPSAPQASATGGGGGAGGSFRTAGGNGGMGDADTTAGGTAIAPVAAPTTLRGGCPGQTGAIGQAQMTAPGSGGGAVVVLAGAQIALGDAQIAVNGAGAAGGKNRAGGSGGGSGGMLVLDAPAITAGAAKLSANGGGGAGGADGQSALDGSDPDPLNPATAALGAPPGKGGAGGNGAAGTAAATSGGDTPPGTARGGGGGGGGGGYIRANVAISGAASSPAIDVVP